jgi:hypothetical protein
LNHFSRNKDLYRAVFLILSGLLIMTLVIVFSIQYGDNRCPRTSSALDKKNTDSAIKTSLPHRQRMAFTDWRDEAVWKVRRAGMVQAQKIVDILSENHIYEPGAAAEVIVETLGVRNPDLQLIMNTARKRISAENLKKSLEIARENQAALYFTLPIIKGAIIDEIEKSRVN